MSISTSVTWPPLSILCLGAVLGCQNTQYVTRAELYELLREPESMTEAKRTRRQAEVEQLIADAMTAPTLDARASAAMAAADRSTAELRKTLAAIDLAEGVTLENLRNVDTIAFKTHLAVHEAAGELTFSRDTSQGPFLTTNRAFDVAIQGDGFFRVRGGFGDAYTRNGNFFTNSKGELVLGTGDGYLLQPKIDIPTDARDITINTEGDIEFILPDKTFKTRVGPIKLTTFSNPQGLKLLGGSLYLESESSGKPLETQPNHNGSGVLLQNFLEGSNVELDRERLRLRFLRTWRKSIEATIDANAR